MSIDPLPDREVVEESCMLGEWQHANIIIYCLFIVIICTCSVALYGTHMMPLQAQHTLYDGSVEYSREREEKIPWMSWYQQNSLLLQQ